MGVRQGLRLGAQQGQLVRAFEERKHGVRDEVGRGVVAVVHHEEHQRDDLGLAEPVAVRVAGLHQRRDHVVLGLGPAPLDEPLHVREHALGAGGEVVGVGVVVHPRAHLRLIGLVDADELADDGAGQRRGVLLDQVARTLRGELLEKPGGYLLDARPQRLHAPHGERGRDEAAQAGVVVAVLEHHVRRDVVTELVRQIEGRDHLVRHAESLVAGNVAVIHHEPRVAEDRLDLLVACDQPDRWPTRISDAN
ncbi:hypothetical protein RB200_36930 [Streptomyces sp. PmtG]